MGINCEEVSKYSLRMRCYGYDLGGNGNGIAEPGEAPSPAAYQELQSYVAAHPMLFGLIPIVVAPFGPPKPK